MGKNIAILASGNGTNAENIIRYFREKATARVALVLTNRPSAYVLQRAASLDVPALCFSKDEWADGRPVLQALQAHAIDFVVLAGFLARVPDNILHAYPQRMVNIHPSLLPKFGGKGMYGDRVHQAVLAAGETESGITIHYTNEPTSITTRAPSSASMPAPSCRTTRRTPWPPASTGWSMPTIPR